MNVLRAGVRLDVRASGTGRWSTGWSSTGEGPGIDGGLSRREYPGQPPTNVIAVPSVDDSTRAILAAGGTEVVPKMAVPGVGWSAYFTDTEGNQCSASSSSIRRVA